MRVSRSQVSAAEQPILHQIQAERAANLAKAQQQMGFAKAAAALLQGVAPRVQQTYSNAANADAGYAHGLGSEVQASIQQNANSDNSFLQRMGTPAAGMVHPADVGGTAYGLEGYIPATTLQREGAAFGSAAQMLPGQALRQGQQAASATVANDPNLASLQGDLAKLAATQPAVYQKTLEMLSNMGYKKAELQLSAQRLSSDNQYRQAELGQRQQTINNEQAYRGQELKLSLKRLGISKRSLQLRAQAQEARLHGGGSGGKPKFTPDELVHIRGLAGSIAMDAKNGVKMSDGKTIDPRFPPVTLKKAMQLEIQHGVPPSIAIKALREAGYNVPLPVTPAPGSGIGSGAMFGKLAGPARLVAALRRYPNLDPHAVLAIATQEGLAGGVGDNGSSFGPFQLHAGGALPERVWAKGARYAQRWAWSPAGINYALRRIERIAGGLRGEAAIAAISREFERPANPSKEIAGAMQQYGRP